MFTYTIVHHPVLPALAGHVPYAVAAVHLADAGGVRLLGNLACLSRIAILYLIPPEKLSPADAKSGRQVPHITFHLDVRGLVPIDVAGFDAEAFMKNVRENHSRDILSKLAPHLYGSTNRPHHCDQEPKAL